MPNAKAVISDDDAILAGLRKAYAKLPSMILLIGASGKGLFAPATGKGQKLADLAVAQGFLAKSSEMDRSGKKPKPVINGRLTEAGIRRVIDADGPKAAMEALRPAIEAISNQPEPLPPNTEIFLSALGKATESCLSSINNAFAHLERAVLTTLSPPSSSTVDSSTVLNALHLALKRVEAPVIHMPASPIEPTLTSPNESMKALEEAIVKFVLNWVKEKTVGCQFDVLWKHLKEHHPEITTGSFQDSLRKLHDSSRIRLGGWSYSYDDIPKPELAFFVSHKVMYYAHNAQ